MRSNLTMADGTIAKVTPTAEVSGAEIWNWAARMSEHAQLLHERRTLVEDIRRARTECGSCSHWMTRNCPMEKHSNQTGRSTGPSNQAFKCVKFDMSQHIEKFIVTKQGRLDEVHELLKRANALGNRLPASGAAKEGEEG